MCRLFPLLFAICLILSNRISAAVDAGTDAASLDAAIALVNPGPDFDLDFSSDVSLLTQVRALNAEGTFLWLGNAITVSGNGRTLNGSNLKRGLFISGEGSSSTGTVTIEQLHFLDCHAIGGAGGTGGGGGMGAGGALFLGRNVVVTARDCTFTNCQAIGGDSAALFNSGFGGGGGGGLGGTGASDLVSGSTPGGGGFGGNGSNASNGAGGGASDFPVGNASGTTPGRDFDGGGSSGDRGNGGAGASNTKATDGGYGGGGGGASGLSGEGGNGGKYGGGGRGFIATGNGGFGGGGGAVFSTNPTMGGDGGDGGFGGGGGASHDNGGVPGLGGFGGGNGEMGDTGRGGVGAGFGGAIFLEPGAQLTLAGSATFANCDASSGSGGTANTDPSAGFGSLGREVFMMASSTLIVDNTSPVSIPHPIEGNQGNEFPNPTIPTLSGGLIKRGSSLLTLNGANTYTGHTRVEEGELHISSGGSLITNVTVSSGATFSGNLSIQEDIQGNGGDLENEGMVSPGVMGVGSINLDGAFTQKESGVLLIDITPTGNVNDKLLGAQSATLDGEIRLLVDAGNYIAGTQYLVIDAPVMGAFESLVEVGDLGDQIAVEIDYSNGVLLEVVTTRIFEDQMINSGVPTQVARCFTCCPIPPGTDFAFVTEVLGTLSNQELNQALFDLSAVDYGAFEWVSFQTNYQVVRLLRQRKYYQSCPCSSCPAGGLWVSGFGNWMDLPKKRNNLQKYSADSSGVVFGGDIAWDCATFGGVVGYRASDFSFKRGSSNGETDAFFGSLYGSFSMSWYDLDWSVLGGWESNQMNRSLVFGTIDRLAIGSFDSVFAVAHLGFSTCVEIHLSQWELFGGVDYHYYHRESLSEKGADSLNLALKPKSQHFLLGESGLRWSSCWWRKCEWTGPFLAISWVGEFPLQKSKEPARFIDRQCLINSTSYKANPNHLVSPQAGVWVEGGCNLTINLSYKGYFNTKTQVNTIEGGASWSF